MKAFNARLQPKQIMGMPAYTIGGFIMTIPATVLAIMVPFIILKFFLGVLAFGAFCFAVFFMIIGDEAPFLPTKFAAMRERNNVTVEVVDR